MGKRFTIEFYTKENGEAPAMDFILSQSAKMQAKIRGKLERLAIEGNLLGDPDSKALSNGILELRIKLGSDSGRIFYFFVVGRKIILTNGFMKKSQETPSKELEKAVRYRADYMRRNQ